MFVSKEGNLSFLALIELFLNYFRYHFKIGVEHIDVVQKNQGLQG